MALLLRIIAYGAAGVIAAAGTTVLALFGDGAAALSDNGAALLVTRPVTTDVRVGGGRVLADATFSFAPSAAVSYGGGSDDGLLFIYPEKARRALSLAATSSPADVLWFADGRVADFETRILPVWNASGAVKRRLFIADVGTDSVLVTGSGFVALYDIRVGDAVEIAYGIRDPIVPPASGGLATLPGRAYFIETMRQNPVKGKNFRVGEVIEDAGAYKKYAIFYNVGTLRISGVMTVPAAPAPERGFPVLILNHGLISSSIYYSGRGSRREKDFFGRNGYVTIHPDYRGLGQSSPNPARHHDFYAGYTEDVIAAVDALKEANPSYADESRIGMWGHSMGGGIAARVMVLHPDIKAFVLFAPISADAYDNFFELPAVEVEWLKKTYGASPATTRVYDLISPLSYFHDVTAPVQLHHGTKDGDVPIAFSQKMYDTLKKQGNSVEFYRYGGERHEFIPEWGVAARRALYFFDTYVKNAQ
ncbi:MAG: alpha/beta fold hydrolase [Patescibacteria group bacterium]